MRARRYFQSRVRWLTLISGVAACAPARPPDARATPVASTRAPSSSARPPDAASPPSSSASPPAAASVAPAAQVVWTTPDDSDACREYAAESAPLGSAFATRAECEAWVATRACRPRSRCYDGCNWVSCQPDGMHVVSTMRACYVAPGEFVQFARGSADAQRMVADWPAIMSAARRVIAPAQRKLLVLGYGDPSEAASAAARDKLALRRAQVVRDRLLALGLPADRMEARAADARHFATLRDAQLMTVRFSASPDRMLPEDVDPSSELARQLCGKPGSAGAPRP